MGITLRVPHIRQESSMSCWHASARMLAGYRGMCIAPLHDRYVANRGLTARQFIDLARAAGLTTLPPVNQSYGAGFIAHALATYGPLWAAGYWNGQPHIVVIVGVDDAGRLAVNDPAFAAPVVRDMAWFNARIATDVPIPMMYMPPQ